MKLHNILVKGLIKLLLTVEENGEMPYGDTLLKRKSHVDFDMYDTLIIDQIC